MSFPLLFDDAAIFPPGNLRLPEAILAHREHLKSSYAGQVGPLVVTPVILPVLEGEGPLSISVVVANVAAATAAIAVVAELEGIRLAALEIKDTTPAEVRESLVKPAGVTVFVELPWDDRLPILVKELSTTTYRAKLRTGGLDASMFPTEVELAEALMELGAAKVPFKATAGLHHAVRNTDTVNGFEQHGFVNLLVAAELARRGAEVEDVAAVLAERDASLLPAIPHESLLKSIGTCVISEPIEELAELGLVRAA